MTHGAAKRRRDGPRPRSERRHNYVIRHWRGDLRLPVTFWVNGVIATILWTIATRALRFRMYGADPRWFLYLGCGLAAAFVAMFMWQVVGIWRSAGQHARQGRGPHWSALARITVVLWVGAMLVNVPRSIWPAWRTALRELQDEASHPAYLVRPLRGGAELEFHGKLRLGAARTLELALRQYRQARVLHLNSEGGNINEGLRMGAVIKARQLTVYTSEVCSSAATLALVGGRERIVGPRARIGFHRPSGSGQDDIPISYVEKWLREAQLSEAFVRRALATSSSDMWYPTVAELREAGVVTAESAGDRFAVSGDELDEALTVLDGGIVPNGRLQAQYQGLGAETQRRVLQAFSTVAQAGGTEQQAQAAAQRTIASVVHEHIFTASDEALLGFMDQLTEAARSVRDSFPGVCVALLEGGSDDPRQAEHLPAEVTSRIVQAGRHLAESNPGGPAIAIDERRYQKDAGEWVRMFRQSNPEDADFLSRSERWSDDPVRACRVVLAFRDAIQAWPLDRRANLYRGLNRYAQALDGGAAGTDAGVVPAAAPGAIP